MLLAFRRSSGGVSRWAWSSRAARTRRNGALLRAEARRGDALGFWAAAAGWEEVYGAVQRGGPRSRAGTPRKERPARNPAGFRCAAVARAEAAGTTGLTRGVGLS